MAIRATEPAEDGNTTEEDGMSARNGGTQATNCTWNVSKLYQEETRSPEPAQN